MKVTPLLVIAAVLGMTLGGFFLAAQSEEEPFDLSNPDTWPNAIKKAEADAKPLPEPKAVTMLFEWIELDHRVANKMLANQSDPIRANKLRAELEVMLDAGDAELLETSFINTKPALRATAQSKREHLYVTSADPPEIPQTMKGRFEGSNFPITPASPTAFDIRDVGTSVEIEANLYNWGKVIEANIAPEIVRFLGNYYLGKDKAPTELQSHALQPKFRKMGAPGTLSLLHGQHAIAGIFKPEGKPDRRILLMVRANTLYQEH